MEVTKGSISIDTENIFPIIKKWLYSDKDIFIRELISNGCDAVSKYKRLVSLGEIEAPQDEKYKIIVSVSKSNKTIKFSDNGIGMTAEEVDKYINQVAFSGAEDFFNKYKDKMEESNDIIGHFGLGFYSAFMVSSKVEIDTLSYINGAKPVRWISEGGTEFEISESVTRTERGTTITLSLAEDSEEFLDEYHVRGIIDKYCSFLPVEIYVENEDVEVKEGEEKIELTPLNDTNPLWLKSPKDCTDEEYKEFYRKVFNVYDEPLFWIHLNVDYPFNLKGILYFPKLNNEFELVEGKVKLYNNQVFVADNIKEVIPEFLLLLKGVIDCPDLPLNVSRSFLQNDKDVSKISQVFVADNIKEVIPEFLLLLKGVIDCPDLPLNVSRSFLQNDKDVSKISKHIVKKVADKLKSLFKNNREEYNKFWDDIQIFIKFGCLKDEGFYEKIKDYILYKDINGKYITLTDYLESAKEKHENKVFYVNNIDQQSQYVKLFKDYDLNAVVLDCTIDNNFISFIEYKEMGIKFNRIDSNLSDVLKDKDNEDDKENNEIITNLFKDVINDRVEKYSVESLKSEDTPAMILVSEESRRMMEMQARFAGMSFGMDLKEEKTLVINKNNPLVKKLLSLKDNEYKKEDINVICNQIVDLALLSNKELNAEELDLFIKRSNQLMSKVISL